MNSKLFCSAVLFVLFLSIVANFNNNKGLFNKLISLFLLLAVITSILSASSETYYNEKFQNNILSKDERIKLLDSELKSRKELRNRLNLEKLPELECNEKRVISLGSGHHPLKDIPSCVDEQNMFIFSKSKCRPECCDFGKNNGFSCSSGCVCKD